MVNVVGLGYIGLPTALILASHGIHVTGTDCDAEVISRLSTGMADFTEPGFDELYRTAVERGIFFTAECVQADTYIVAVPTPYDKATHKVNPQYVISAVNDILGVCLENADIIIESTVPPGTINKYIKPLTAGRNIGLIHAPERIAPGNMLHELENNSRTIGADDPAAAKRAAALYATFCKSEIVLTDIRTAEMTKVVENAYRDVNIAYANELVKICRSGGIDVNEVIRIANKHPRVNILSPGPGVGGHCISVDPWFLAGDYPALAKIIMTSRQINDSMPEYVLERIYTIMRERGMTDVSRVGLYGLTYKENVPDTRESPALQLLECMARHLSGGLKVYDPYVRDDIVQNQYHSMDAFLNDIDIVVIMAAHSEILRDTAKLQNKIILDTRNSIALSGVYRL